IKAPRIPVDKYCGEAEELYSICQNDKSQLLSAGLNWQDVEDLKSLCKALRYCQANWVITPARSQEMKQWLSTKKEALALKKEMLRHFDYAFRRNAAIKKELSDIRTKRDNKSIAFVLLQMCELAENNAHLLQKVNFDKDLTLKARTLSFKCSENLALVNTSNGKSENKLWRDRAYTLLFEKVTTIRTCGQYLFKSDKKKYQKYLSDYFRKYNKHIRKPR
ncbi:MAG: hypothetical protein MI866_07730, partial [Bacteroidales bacterium]|nr:hypothetical protein [Bacteroidales bacterium]